MTEIDGEISARETEIARIAEYGKARSALENTLRKFYGPRMGRPSLAPGIYFRSLLIWSLAKRKLSNSCPNDLDKLINDIVGSIEGVRSSEEKLRGYIDESELPFSFKLKYRILYAGINNELEFRVGRGRTRLHIYSENPPCHQRAATTRSA